MILFTGAASQHALQVGVVSQHALQQVAPEGSTGSHPGGISRPIPGGGSPSPHLGGSPGRPLHEWLLPRAVGILLECILAEYSYCKKKMKVNSLTSVGNCNCCISSLSRFGNSLF